MKIQEYKKSAWPTETTHNRDDHINISDDADEDDDDDDDADDGYDLPDNIEIAKEDAAKSDAEDKNVSSDGIIT